VTNSYYIVRKPTTNLYVPTQYYEKVAVFYRLKRQYNQHEFGSIFKTIRLNSQPVYYIYDGCYLDPVLKRMENGNR